MVQLWYYHRFLHSLIYKQVYIISYQYKWKFIYCSYQISERSLLLILFNPNIDTAKYTIAVLLCCKVTKWKFPPKNRCYFFTVPSNYFTLCYIPVFTSKSINPLFWVLISRYIIVLLLHIRTKKKERKKERKKEWKQKMDHYLSIIQWNAIYLLNKHWKKILITTARFLLLLLKKK